MSLCFTPLSHRAIMLTPQQGNMKLYVNWQEEKVIKLLSAKKSQLKMMGTVFVYKKKRRMKCQQCKSISKMSVLQEKAGQENDHE